MRLSILNQDLLCALNNTVGVIEKKQTLPILGNILFTVRGERLELTATDLEMEMRVETNCGASEDGEFTLSGRKIFDICRNLRENDEIRLDLKGQVASVKARESSFLLSTLPAVDFPVMGEIEPARSLAVAQQTLKVLTDQTFFAIAQNDVRYYLNGLYLEVLPQRIKAVGTDGHRLACCDLGLAEEPGRASSVLIPRKTVAELRRILEATKEPMELALAPNFVRFKKGTTTLTSKLIDGRFPDYTKVIPKGLDKIVEVDRDRLKESLLRMAVLTYEKLRGVNITFDPGLMILETRNPEQEEGEERIEIAYQGDSIRMGFNIGYLLDILGVINSERLTIEFKDSDSAMILRGSTEPDSLFVLMPMRI